MKKSHNAITAFLLTAAVLLTGCSDRNNSLSPTTDTSSTTVSQPENSSYTESSTPESSVQVTSKDTEPVPVEFTDEDRELQKILSDLEEPAWQVVSMFSSLGVYGNEDSLPQPHQFLRLTIIELPFLEMECDKIPDNFHPEHYMFDVPTSKAEMGNFISKYYSKEMTDTLLERIPVCELVERSGDTLTVKLKDDPGIYQKEGFQIWFVEVDGRLYVRNSQGAPGFIEVDTAKVTRQTSDTIEFDFIPTGLYWVASIEQFLNDVSLYSEWAQEGMLKLEDGVWKLHSWDDMNFPLRN